MLHARFLSLFLLVGGLHAFQWAAATGGQYCGGSTDATGATCWQDTSGDYGENEECSFTLTGAATLFRAEWGLEASSNCGADFVQVNGGSKYCGSQSDTTAFPASLSVSGLTTFTFKTDHSVTGSGFKICAYPFPSPSPVGCTSSSSCIGSAGCAAGYFETTFRRCAACPAGTAKAATAFMPLYAPYRVVTALDNNYGNRAAGDATCKADGFNGLVRIGVDSTRASLTSICNQIKAQGVSADHGYWVDARRVGSTAQWTTLDGMDLGIQSWPNSKMAEMSTDALDDGDPFFYVNYARDDCPDCCIRDWTWSSVGGVLCDSSNPSSTCETCLAGTYSTAGTACTKCAAGKASPAMSGSADDCVDCDAGKYAQAGDASCADCAAGKFTAAGEESCTDCAAGKYAQAGDASCTDCAAGKFTAAGEESCTDCAAGKFVAAGGASSCAECPTGKYNTPRLRLYMSCSKTGPTLCLLLLELSLGSNQTQSTKLLSRCFAMTSPPPTSTSAASRWLAPTLVRATPMAETTIALSSNAS